MSDDKDPQRISDAADNCEVLRARLAKYEDAEGNPISTIAEQARGIERLRLNIAEYNEHERCYQSELAALKAQPSGVVLPERLDIPHRDEFESADQYAAAVGEAKKWNACLDEVACLNSSPVSAGVALSGSRTGRVYIAGPMTGYENYNFTAFNAESDRLRAQGLHVENPADHGVVDGADWADYLRYDISRLSTCERIHLLPGWSKSKGARLEIHIAQALGMHVWYAEGAEAVGADVVDERAAFEAAVCERYGYTGGSIISRRVGDYYADASLSQAWALWQARASLTASAPNHSEQVQAWRDVLAERHRQITAEDFDASHDDMATRGQIAMAAGLYALDAANLAAGRISLSHPSSLWPWPEEWWKPAGSRRNLIKAGALILAEIERLDRAAAPSAGSQGGDV